MLIYHGSEGIIEKPSLKLGKPNNDFGKGFYCTNDIKKAKEWACKNNIKGYVNCYELSLSKLHVLDLTTSEYNILNWISILLHNRTFSIENEFSKNVKEYLDNNYYIDTTLYDVVIGYRADDSYFSFAQSFIDNSLSLENLQKAMNLGNLGIQIVLVSDLAFKKLKYKGCEEVNNFDVYYKKFITNDNKAREEYKQLKNMTDEKYIIDLIREK